MRLQGQGVRPEICCIQRWYQDAADFEICLAFLGLSADGHLLSHVDDNEAIDCSAGGALLLDLFKARICANQGLVRPI